MDVIELQTQIDSIVNNIQKGVATKKSIFKEKSDLINKLEQKNINFLEFERKYHVVERKEQLIEGLFVKGCKECIEELANLKRSMPFIQQGPFKKEFREVYDAIIDKTIGMFLSMELAYRSHEIALIDEERALIKFEKNSSKHAKRLKKKLHEEVKKELKLIMALGHGEQVASEIRSKILLLASKVSEAISQNKKKKFSDSMKLIMSGSITSALAIPVNMFVDEAYAAVVLLLGGLTVLAGLALGPFSKQTDKIVDLALDKIIAKELK